jgi:hypothetical protein
MAKISCKRVGLIDLIGLLWRNALTHILLIEWICAHRLWSKLRCWLVEEVVCSAWILWLNWLGLKITEISKSLLVGKLISSLWLSCVLEAPVLVLELSRLLELIVVKSRSRLLSLWLKTILI